MHKADPFLEMAHEKHDRRWRLEIVRMCSFLAAKRQKTEKSIQKPLGATKTGGIREESGQRLDRSPLRD
jgi:hypothetical protein